MLENMLIKHCFQKQIRVISGPLYIFQLHVWLKVSKETHCHLISSCKDTSTLKFLPSRCFLVFTDCTTIIVILLVSRHFTWVYDYAASSGYCDLAWPILKSINIWKIWHPLIDLSWGYQSLLAIAVGYWLTVFSGSVHSLQTPVWGHKINVAAIRH